MVEIINYQEQKVLARVSGRCVCFGSPSQVISNVTSRVIHFLRNRVTPVLEAGTMLVTFNSWGGGF